MSVNIYPVVKTADVCNDYEVRINGKIVDLNTARVSAVPFNRRWPGHQRQKSQTELVNFLSYEADEKVTFEITPKDPFDDVVIRPLSSGIKPEIKNGTITFSLEKPAFVTVEPYGIHRALHIFGDPVSSYDVDFDDENVLYFGKGEHDEGVIELKSNQTLFIDEGAVVYACVHAIDAENIRILGRGILDNSRNKEQIKFEANVTENKSMVCNAVRKHTVELEYCTGIEIDGITIRDSLVYNIKPVACENIHISHVKLIGNWRYNSDGINTLNCKNVLIEDCFLRTFDDAICTKGFDFYTVEDVDKAVYEASHRNGRVYNVAKNITARRCTIWADYSGGLCVGAETKAEEMCDIVYEDCDIIHFNCGAMDCFNIDYAHVHDVVYQNINVEYDDVVLFPHNQKSDDHEYENTDPDWTPYLLAVRTMYHHEYSKGGARRGKTDNIVFKNIRLSGRHRPKIKLFGHDDEHKTKDIRIENLYRNGKPVTKWDDFILEIGDFTENIQLEFTD